VSKDKNRMNAEEFPQDRPPNDKKCYFSGRNYANGAMKGEFDLTRTGNDDFLQIWDFLVTMVKLMIVNYIFLI
jgi:hypothetical protein